MRLDIVPSGGMAPKLDPVSLAEGLATLARNARFDRGVLAPCLLGLVASPEFADSALAGRGVKAAVRLLSDGTRLAFSDPRGADTFASLVAPADKWGRVYFMSAAGPRFATKDQITAGGLTINPTSFALGVPAPALAPDLTDAELIQPIPEEGQEPVEPDIVDVAYAYSFVDAYGHEGPLSPPSRNARVPYNLEFRITLGLTSALPTGVNMADGYLRVYRATFDGSSSAWQFLTDLPSTSTQLEDTLPLGQEGETAVSEEWEPPPAGLKQLVAVNAAFAAGFFDHYVCYSVAKLPHAWPTEYQYPLPYQPVKLLPMNDGLLIVTTGKPYWASGSDPASALPAEMPINAPCLAPSSLVDMGGYAIYASHEGLVAVSASEARILTRELVDREAFLALTDEHCRAFLSEGRYVFSTRDGRWLAFDPSGEAPGFVELDFGLDPLHLSAVYFSPRANQHYFALADGTIRVIDYDALPEDSEWMVAPEWHSRHVSTPPVGFSCARLLADTYPVRLTVRSQMLGATWREYTCEVTDRRLVRLPGWLGELWQVQVVLPFGGRLHQIRLAQSGQEIA